MLVINAKLPVKSLQEFVALAKSKPGAMNYGTTGIGAANHLVTELFSGKAGLKMTHIPYRGTALAVADLIGGQVTMVFGDPVSVLPHMQAGTLRALAVTSPQRSPVAPRCRPSPRAAIPASRRSPGTASSRRRRRRRTSSTSSTREIVKALQHPEIKDVLIKQAMQPVGNTPAEFAAFIKKDIAIWKAVATEADVSVK